MIVVAVKVYLMDHRFGAGIALAIENPSKYLSLNIFTHIVFKNNL